MEEFIYLFQSSDNGYGNIDYTYFSSEIKITQEMSNIFIRKVNGAAGRIGSNFDDFKKGAELNNIKIKELKGQHRLTELTNVINNITGNY